MLKREMNETRLELASSFNSSILPTPPMSALSAENAREMELSLCGDLDTSIVDDTAKALNKLSTVAIGLMFVLLVACWLALCGWEWYRWKCLNDTVETMEDEWKAEGQRDGWRAVAVVENPVLERYGSPILRRMARKERTRRNTRWYCECKRWVGAYHSSFLILHLHLPPLGLFHINQSTHTPRSFR